MAEAKRVVGKPFRKGQSGNPGGRPKRADDVKELARKYTAEAVERLVMWMRGDNAKASVAACNALLDRAWGKPAQPLSGADGRPVPFTINIGDAGKSDV